MNNDNDDIGMSDTTRALVMVVDNNHTMYEHLIYRAMTIVTRCGDLQSALEAERERARAAQSLHDIGTAREMRRLTISYLADDFRDYFRDDVRARVAEAASIRTIYGDDVDVERQHRLRMAGVDVISAMAAHALSGVDWLMLATSYLDLADERQMGMQGVTA